MGQKPKRGRPRSDDHGTPAKQFRLSEETLAEIAYLQERFGLTSRSAVIRLAVRRVALEEKRKP